ncbi:hypothetical protein ACFLTK_03200 [Chloroflexota bacterium]
MEQETLKNKKSDELGKILQKLPQIMEQIRSEFELFSGKPLISEFTSTELRSLERKLRKLYLIAKEIEVLQEEDLTPVSARKWLFLINDYFRLIIRRVPKNREPLDYATELLKRLKHVPSNHVLPDGLDFTSKYDGLRIFINELLVIIPKSNINLFLNDGLTEHHLVPQLQRALNNLSLPKGLKTPPKRTTMQTAEKLKLALHDVINDWEVLIDLVYGLILCKDGHVPIWSNARKVKLWDKVEKIGQEPNLAALVKTEWVTIRNAIAHGRALFVPSENGIMFPDRKRIVSWTLTQAYFEAVDIYLANQAMLRIWNIAQLAALTDSIEQITRLRVLAQQ